ncbi:hypothetical protein B0H19DRAFT_895512, partial [Mycena capillaripes]
LHIPAGAHLATKYSPLDTERKEIEAYCQRGFQKIARISVEIQTDIQRLQNSTERRAALQALVDPSLAFLSPIRAIPPEILQEIFAACMPTRHCAIMNPSQAPFLLGRVCSAWRKIAFSIPVL